jgi:hypothetical protein
MENAQNALEIDHRNPLVSAASRRAWISGSQIGLDRCDSRQEYVGAAIAGAEIDRIILYLALRVADRELTSPQSRRS